MFLRIPLLFALLSQLVRPGGVVAFHELSGAFSSACSAPPTLVCRRFSSPRDLPAVPVANTEMGFALYRIFQEAGLPRQP